jgi:polar amino acid transport system substrate-binding protein
MRHRWPYWRAFVLLLAVMTPPALADAQGKSKLDEVLARGYVIVGTSSEAPPFGFINEKGELVGFDVDIAKLVAKAIFGSEKIEFVKQGFAARWANVQAGKIDFGIQVTTIYPDRALKVAFTRPYVDSGITMVVKKGSPIQKLADLNNEKYTVANLTTPVQADRSKKFFPKAKTVTFDSVAAQFTAVKTARAEAAQLDVPVALWYAKDHPDIRVLDEWLTDPTNNAIFLKLDDFAWWRFLDTVVGEMRGGSLFSEYRAIHKKWFGVDPQHEKWYVGKQ